MASLDLASITVAFGGVKALSEVSLRVTASDVHGLIGPNGAGKSTCINVLTGFQRAGAGSITFNGRRIDNAPPEKVRNLGISRTFQAGRLFSMLTVRENLAAAAVGLGFGRSAAYGKADKLLDWMGIAHLSEIKAGVLAYTDQRRVAVARSLVGRPGFLLLDEPAAGMSAAEALDFAALVRRIRTEFGTSILLVEHNISLVLSLCTKITVLDGGLVIAEGTPGEIRDSARVREAYLGTSAPAAITTVAA